MFKNFSFKVLLAATAALIGILPSAQADEGCGCGVSTDSYVADAGCGSCGCGGNFLSKLRSKVNCDPAMRTGLWDGYCQERTACDSVSSGCGAGLSLGCGKSLGCGTSSGCGLGSKFFSGGCSLFSGSGSGCGGSCFTPAVASCGCGHIFGGSSCFRNDGHFFGNFRRHHCGRRSAPAVQEIDMQPSCGEVAPAGCGCASRHRCNLFSGCRSKGGFFGRIKGLFGRSGSCGCGHFGGGCDSSMSYDVQGDCGCSQPVAVAPSCGCNG